jgi:hypothetical protein
MECSFAVEAIKPLKISTSCSFLGLMPGVKWMSSVSLNFASSCTKKDQEKSLEKEAIEMHPATGLTE